MNTIHWLYVTLWNHGSVQMQPPNGLRKRTANTYGNERMLSFGGFEFRL